MTKKNINPLNFHTREEVEFFGKPFFTGHRWFGLEDEKKRIFLTKTRAAKLGFPIAETEEPAAYRYTSNGPAKLKYVPVYDRTNCDISEKELFPNEIYPFIKGR
ncbi:hypothetical protein WD019_21120 [Fictibacillus sp. Mic-4]|uniref:hypothetical protein n=1 Tax=Fictibacillus sp. Mic-4 TaxID=3132826 RepID=UPI003CF3921E